MLLRNSSCSRCYITISVQERVVEEKPKKSNWKEKHEEFVRNIRYAREAKAAEERGEEVAPPPPSQKPSDHVQCPTCGRS